MRSRISIILSLVMVFLLSGCYDRDVVDSKEFNHSIPPVENATCVKDGNTAVLTWTVPTSITDDIEKPVYVDIQVVENNIYTDHLTIAETSGTTTTVNIDPTKSYHFIFKTLGFLKEESRATGESDRVCSKATIVELK